MSDDWNTKPLGELAENISRRFDFSNKEKVIFINTGDVLEGNFLHREYSESSTLPGQAKKAIKKGDILYSEIRPGNKRYVLIDFDADDYVVSTKFMVIKAKEKILPEYLYLILTSQECEQEFKLIADSRSGTFPQITFDSVTYYPIKYPVKEEQQRLVNIAGSITGKIELNRQTNQTLEQIAQALFKSWFVDFDPVKAKIAAKQAGGSAEQIERAAMAAISGKTETQLDQLTPEQYTNLKTTAALFPDELVDSELGKIPTGWHLGHLDDVILQRNERIKASDETNQLPYVPIDCITAKSLFLKEYKNGEEAKSSLTKIYKGDFVFGAMRPYFHKVCIAPFDATTRTTAFVLTPKQETDYSFAILRLHETDTIDYATLHSTGSTIPYAKWDGSLSKMNTVIPPVSLREHFNQLVKPLLDSIPPKIFECENLKSLRDSLLPKLLSGGFEND